MYSMHVKRQRTNEKGKPLWEKEWEGKVEATSFSVVHGSIEG